MIVDTNVYLSRWPFRRLAGDEAPDLAARLRRQNVTQAWAGSFDGILHKDIAGVNSRLAADCRAYGQNLLLPFGSINPKLPGWQEDLRRCHEDHKMRGIRLHPNYHGYVLSDAVFAELLRLAAERSLIVQIATSMEDIRTQHPLVRVPPLDVSALPQVVKGAPPVRLVLLNWWTSLRTGPPRPFLDAGRVYFDIASFEGIEGIGRLAANISAERIVFGSNFPLFNFTSALLKMRESGLPEQQQEAIFAGNARRILERAGG